MTSTRVHLGGATYMVVAAAFAAAAWGTIKGFLFLGHTLAALIVMGLVAGGGIGASLLLRNRLDEAGRSAEQFAWYWGGGGGMAVTLLGLLAYALIGAPWAQTTFSSLSPIALICLGAFGLAAAQVMGFAIVGAAWWRARR